MFAQHYSLIVFYPILLWFTYALFIQANPVAPGPPKSAQVLPDPQALSQEILNRFHPGSPKKSRNFHKIAENNTHVLPGNPGKSA